MYSIVEYIKSKITCQVKIIATEVRWVGVLDRDGQHESARYRGTISRNDSLVKLKYE